MTTKALTVDCTNTKSRHIWLSIWQIISESKCLMQASKIRRDFLTLVKVSVFPQEQSQCYSLDSSVITTVVFGPKATSITWLVCRSCKLANVDVRALGWYSGKSVLWVRVIREKEKTTTDKASITSLKSGFN